MRNHKEVKVIESFRELMTVLTTDKSIYLKSAGRVMPTAFFFRHSWVGKFQEHIDKGDFVQVISKRKLLAQNIQKALKDSGRVMVSFKSSTIQKL